MSDMYCGAGPVPKGKIRGTPEYCVENKQVRYYGIVALPPHLAEKAMQSGKKLNLLKEQIKGRKLGDKRILITKRAKTLAVIIGNEEERETKRNSAKKELKKIIESIKKLDKQIAAQNKLIDQIKEEKEKEEARKKKEAEKIKKAKSKEKEAKKKADSKTAKKKSAKKSEKKSAKKSTKKSAKKTTKK